VATRRSSSHDIGSVDLVCRSDRRIASRPCCSGRPVWPHHLGDAEGTAVPTRATTDRVRGAGCDRSPRRAGPHRVTHAPSTCWRSRCRRTAWRDYAEDDLFALVTRAWPYRALHAIELRRRARMTGDGFATARGRRGAAGPSRRGERTGPRPPRRADGRIASGGAIPEVADYRVILDPGDLFIGTLNEDFAIESNAGDVFQLGNASWQCSRSSAASSASPTRRARRRRFRSGSARRRPEATSSRARSAICAQMSRSASQDACRASLSGSPSGDLKGSPYTPT